MKVENLPRAHMRMALAGLTTALACSVSGVAFAQSNATDNAANADKAAADTEIIVTAQRREQRLQDVPLAISAVGSEQLADRGVTDISAMSSVVPSLSISGNAGNGGFRLLSIRGLSGQAVPIGQSQTVAVYLDGEYLPKPDAAFFALDDIERLEVLRGPQGTLYGRNATGGAINIITRMPGDQLQGGIDASYGNFNHLLIKGSLNGPLGAGFSAGISGSYEKRDGFFTNSVTGHRVDDAENHTIRGKLRYVSPDNSFNALLSADTSRMDGPAFTAHNIHAFPSTAFVGVPDPSVVNIDAATEALTFLRQKSDGGALTMNLAASDNIDLTSVTTYRKFFLDLAYDLDMSAVPSLVSKQFGENKVFSQEVRGVVKGDRITLTVGANYYRDHQFFNFATASNGTNVNQPYTSPRVDSKLEAVGVFGQIEFKITPELTLTGGLRWNSETTNYIVDYTQSTGATGAVVAGNYLTGKVSDHAFIPSGGIDYKVSSDVLIYAKVSKGYQAPGFNGFPGPTATIATSFNAERLTAYEVGVKSQFWDRRATFNLAGFYYDYKDLQVRNTLGPGRIETTNAGLATIKGIEAELSVRPTDGLTVSGNLTWLDAHYDNFCEIALISGNTVANGNPACTDAVGSAGFQRAGNKLTNAPEWQGSVAVNYVAPIGGAGDLRMNVSYSFFSSQSYTPSNEPALSSGNVSRLDARIGFMLAGNGPELYVYGKNLTDERFTDYGLRGLAQVALVHTSDPRTYGVGVRYRF